MKLAASGQHVLARLVNGGLLSWGEDTVPQPLPAAVEPAGVFTAYGRSGIITPLVVEHPPANVTVGIGDPLALHVTASAVLPMTYQWLHEGLPVADATNSWLMLPYADAGAVGKYSVQIRTATNALESAPARIEAQPRVHGAVVGWGDPASPVLTQLAVVPPRVRALAAHWDRAIALLEDGTAVAWGSPEHGGTTVPSVLADVVEVAVGESHYLARHRDGRVTAWGEGDFGQHIAPVGLTNVIRIAAGPLHSLALRADGTALGWGYNAYGQAEVPGLRGLVSLAGTFERSAGIHGNGTLSEWGLYSGERPPLLQLVKVLGNGGGAATLSSGGDVHVWGSVPEGDHPQLAPALDLALGDYPYGQSPHLLALTASGLVRGTGRNEFGQATPPAWLRNVIALGAARSVSLAVTTLSIRGQPSPAAALAGTSVSLGVDAVGAPPMNFVWSRNGEVIRTATGPTLNLGVARPADSGFYRVTVANAFAELASVRVPVVILPADAPVLTWNLLGTADPGWFVAAIRVDPALRYDVQGSSDLTTWTPVSLVQSQGPVVLLQQPITASPRRFYRLVRLPN